MEGGDRENSTTHNHLWPPPAQRRTATSCRGIRPWVLVLLFAIFILFISSSSPSYRGLRSAGGLVKNRWDALNLVLVLFAILCGVLSRNPTTADDDTTDNKSRDWLGYYSSLAPHESYTNNTAELGETNQTLSYPDLRQELGPVEEWRFSDDIQMYRTPPASRSPPRSTSPPSSPPSPPPPPPTRRRAVNKLPKTQEVMLVRQTRAPSPPMQRDPRRKKRIGGAAKDFASALAQLYQKKKRKKGSSNSKKPHDDDVSPSSVFNKLFSHKTKSKMIRSVPAPPPQHLPPRSPTPPQIVIHKRRYRPTNVPLPLPPILFASEGTEAGGRDGSEEVRVFCPSPDVNNKADMFIARFRASLQLDKLNSIREKQGQPLQREEDDEKMIIGGLFDRRPQPSSASAAIRNSLP